MRRTGQLIEAQHLGQQDRVGQAVWGVVVRTDLVRDGMHHAQTGFSKCIAREEGGDGDHLARLQVFTVVIDLRQKFKQQADRQFGVAVTLDESVARGERLDRMGECIHANRCGHGCRQ